MRDNNVVIDEKPPASVMTALRTAAEGIVADEMKRIQADAQAMLDNALQRNGAARERTELLQQGVDALRKWKP